MSPTSDSTWRRSPVTSDLRLAVPALLASPRRSHRSGSPTFMMNSALPRDALARALAT
jgi:hypothetical protein